VSYPKFSPKNEYRIKCDLHVHTKASDGAYAPRELVMMARERGIEVLAVTDHDTVTGLPEAAQAAREMAVQLIPGIEISTVHERYEIHILGYQLDPQNKELLATLETIASARSNRARKIVAKLNELGHPVTLDEVLAKAGSEIVGRPHIALAMIDHGIIRSIEEGFDRYLSPGGLAYVPRFRITPQQAIELIHKAGGYAVLAHPGLGFPVSLLPDLLAAGLDGVEVYHPDNSPAIRDYYLRRAHEYGLLITGGSDFHGHDQEDFDFFGNMPVPEETLQKIGESKITPG